MRRYLIGCSTAALMVVGASLGIAPVDASTASPGVTASACTPGTWVQESANVLTSQGGGNLYGSAVATPTLAWAVGEYQKGKAFGSLIEKWTGGTSWSVVGTGGKNAELYKVVAFGANSAFAVGDITTGGVLKPLVSHWNGSTWTRTVFAVPSGTLGSVSGSSANDVWAVGWSSPSSGNQVLIEHWNGSTWTSVTMPTADGPNALLNGVVVVAPGDVWMDGFSDTNINQFWHDNNGTWTHEGTPPDDSYLAGTSDTSIWMPITSASGTALEHWTGSSWTAVDSNSTDFVVLNDIALGASPSTVWAVGNKGVGGSPQKTYISKNGVTQSAPAIRWTLWAMGTGSGLAFAVGGTKDVAAGGEPIVLASCD
jgi:hypothetical protein